MANVDRADGFKFVKTMGGVATAQVRTMPAGNVDFHRGDSISVGAAGVAAVSATNDADFLGVVQGWGKKDPVSGSVSSMVDPANLEMVFFDASAVTNTDYVLYYIPFEGNIFEVQTNADLDFVVGSPCDVAITAGNTTTGNSGHEVGTNTNTDFHVIELMDRVDNDNSLANARVLVALTQTETIFS